MSNVGIATSINFRIQGHVLKLIEVEGCHTVQDTYESLDVHVGQSVTVLVTLRLSTKDYFIIASSRFTKPILTTTAILRYAGSNTKASGPLPIGPTYQLHWSMKQARTIRYTLCLRLFRCPLVSHIYELLVVLFIVLTSFVPFFCALRTNLTANAARPNPQGSYHYGTIPISKTVVLANVETKIKGALRYAVNGISYVDPATPLKLADWFNIPGVFTLNSTKDRPTSSPPVLGVSVLGTTLHDFAEIIFQNNEATVQSWHLDGYSFYTVGYALCFSVWKKVSNNIFPKYFLPRPFLIECQKDAIVPRALFTRLPKQFYTYQYIYN